jgi:hypothetical protein
MIGKRAYPADKHWCPEVGEYGKHPFDGHWIAITPNGHGANLSRHTVTEHEDGTITVSPSILVSDRTGQLWHGFLERGVWREA